jgi:hypothetical protein
MSKQYMSMKEIVSTPRRREGVRASLKAAMEAWAGFGVFVLLFLASLGYVAFGGTLAVEASPIPEPETSIAAVAAESADVSGALRKEKVLARSATEKQ